MADNSLSILTPSVNNLTARIFVRAAGLDYEETDVWGQTTTPEFLAKDPAHLTPLLEEEGLPRGSLWESCAIMQYLCNKHGLDAVLPDRSGPARDGRQRDVLFDRHRLSAGRAGHISYARVPPVRGRGGHLRGLGRVKAKAQKDAQDALAEPLDAYRQFFLDGKQFIGGDSPSIADIRLAATLEFLQSIDYDFPAWARDYMSAVEAALGDAYSRAGRPRARLCGERQVPECVTSGASMSPMRTSCTG